MRTIVTGIQALSYNRGGGRSGDGKDGGDDGAVTDDLRKCGGCDGEGGEEGNVKGNEERGGDEYREGDDGEGGGA